MNKHETTRNIHKGETYSDLNLMLRCRLGSTTWRRTKHAKYKKKKQKKHINILHNCLKLFGVYTGLILAGSVTEYQSYYKPWPHNYTFSILPSWWVWVVLHLQHQPAHAVLASPSVGNQSRAKGMYSLPGSTFFKTRHVTTTPQLLVNDSVQVYMWIEFQISH